MSLSPIEVAVEEVVEVLDDAVSESEESVELLEESVWNEELPEARVEEVHHDVSEESEDGSGLRSVSLELPPPPGVGRERSDVGRRRLIRSGPAFSRGQKVNRKDG